MTADQIVACEHYARGRRLVETAMFHPEQTTHRSEEEREQFRTAERENPKATHRGSEDNVMREKTRHSVHDNSIPAELRRQ